MQTKYIRNPTQKNDLRKSTSKYQGLIRKNMNIILFTDKNPYGFNITDQLMRANIKIKSVLIEQYPPRKRIERFKLKIKAFIPKYFINILRKIRKLESINKWEQNKTYKTISDLVIIVKNFNSEKTELIVKKLNPDLIILAGSRILKENIILIPRIGILNAHPGLLPKYRGVDVIQWAIYNFDPIGVTIHFIDKGVDTGLICKQKKITIEKHDTIESLRRKAALESGILMKNVVLEILENQTIATYPNKNEEGKQYFKMTEEELKEANLRLINININE